MWLDPIWVHRSLYIVFSNNPPRGVALEHLSYYCDTSDYILLVFRSRPTRLPGHKKYVLKSLKQYKEWLTE